MRRFRIIFVGTIVVLAACSGTDVTAGPSQRQEAVPQEPSAPSTTPSVSSSTEPPTATAPSIAPTTVLPVLLAEVTTEWNTDWSKRTIDLEDFRVGVFFSDPRDVIPPLDTPTFTSVAEADLEGREPGIVVEVADNARFYPLRILNLHEVVNDEIGGTFVAVTYCPLCNSAVAFDRRVNGEVLTFGTSGLLRNSDLVMWDRNTESLWQQITGEAVVGELAGTTLEILPSSIVRFSDFAGAYPPGLVLSPDTGIFGAYGVNPYVGYSSAEAPNPAFFRGEPDDRLPALERVIGVNLGTEDKAYPFTEMAEIRVFNDVLGGESIVVFWGAADTADALDANRVETGRAIGTGSAFLRTVDGRTLTFVLAESDGDLYLDLETGSTWNLLGHGIAGPLDGSRLQLAVHTNSFWFAWSAFHPDGILFTGDSD